ncbi:MAG: acyl-CoA dehydratase activase-related protein [Clostridia bacterium]|nr:acyl-CoA dehydratase activase-related protein [Clostridia bacterium]
MKKKSVTIGIPQAMMFYEHGEIWGNFFKSLGCRVVVSEYTNKKILDNGIKNCNNENCLPVKVLMGHVMELMKKSDFIFIPRYTSTNKLEFSCPKFCGLPDMARINLKNEPKIIEIDIDFNNGMRKTLESLRKLSQKINVDYNKAVKIFLNTVKNNLKNDSLKTAICNKNYIAILGHPYLIYDEFLNMNIRKKLSSFDIVTPKDVPFAIKRENIYPKQNFFYAVGYDILGSAFAFMNEPNVKGIIYLSTFSCGVDSILTEYLERYLKKYPSYPYLKITLDEHTGEAGFDTRLEAFIDMIGDTKEVSV